MTLSGEEVAGLGVALNEASSWVSRVDSTRRLAGLTLAVLSLPIEGNCQARSTSAHSLVWCCRSARS
jgi:hypothetical protein